MAVLPAHAVPSQRPAVRAAAHAHEPIDRDRAAVLVDDHLRRCARHEALCRRVLGRLAAAFLLRRAHHRLGFVRLDDYARERLGLSGREVQDLGRVSDGFGRLPAIAAAFDAGELSWTHARLLVSVATPDTEAIWLARARGQPVRALEAAIATDRGRAPEPEDSIDGEPPARFHLRCPRRVRRLWTEVTELASRAAGTRLPAWGAAEAIGAEGLSGIDAAAVTVPPAAPRTTTAVPVDGTVGEAVSDAMPEDVARLASDAEFLDPFRLDPRLRAAVRALQRIDSQTGRLLALVAELRLYRLFGSRSFAGYVHDRLGFSLRKARALLAIESRARHYPALREAYAEGRLSFSRALALLPVLSAETEAAWVCRAQEVTHRRLLDLVGWALEVREPGEPVAPAPADAILLVPPLDAVQMRARHVDAEIVFRGPATVVGLLQTAIAAFTPPSEPPWRGLEALLLHVKAQWEALPRHRDPIFARDGWRCAVPACTARSSLHDHHVVYRSRGGDNSWDNRVAICAAHHLRGIHMFRIKVSGKAPFDLTWEIGWRRGRPPLMRTRGDVYVNPS